ncbi:MAG: hypothetical protein F6K56_13300, partial [Moorea sp. SIO3G5]|nr:hypothetical protein [Moorena sp. SIO3G5]
MGGGWGVWGGGAGSVGRVGSVGSLGRVGSGKKFAELFPTFDCSLFPVPYSLV